MEIKKFINSIKDFRDLSNSDQIPYFVFFLQNLKDIDGVSQSDVRKCFNDTDIHLSINLSNYFKLYIKKKNGQKPLYIKKKNKYFLESSIKDSIKKELKITKPDSCLIDTDMKDKFYNKLIDEINTTNYHEEYTACFILVRKLFENMLIDILRNNFKTEKDLYQNPSQKKKYNDFSVLLNNLKLKKSELGFTTNEINDIIEKLNPYRIEANSKTHSIIDFGTEKELAKYDIGETFDLFFRVWNA